MELEKINDMFKDVDMNEKIIADVKGILNKEEIEENGFRLWRL